MTAPGWKIRGTALLDDYSLDDFVGVATVPDFVDEQAIGPHALRERIERARARRLLIVWTARRSSVSRFSA